MIINKRAKTILKILLGICISIFGLTFLFWGGIYCLFNCVNEWEARYQGHVKFDDPCFREEIISKGPAYEIKGSRVCMEFKRGARRVYTKTLEGADAETFHEISLSYFVDKNHVYYRDKIIKEANPKTFKSIGEHGSYFQDGQNIYYSGKKIDADPDSFIIMKNRYGHSSEYARDRRYVWKFGKKIEGMDASSLTLLSSSYYTKDKNHIYFNDKIFEEADVETFMVLGDTDGSYAKDKQRAYYYGKIIDGADPQSFVALRVWYAFDKNNVYYNEKILEELDARTFEQVGTSRYLRDKNTLYYTDKKVEGVDVEKFYSIAYKKQGKEGGYFLSGMSSCGTDGIVVICNGDKISGGEIISEKESFGNINNHNFRIQEKRAQNK
jgi:hypothetical protein